LVAGKEFEIVLQGFERDQSGIDRAASDVRRGELCED
jgi:hypothetical protein